MPGFREVLMWCEQCAVLQHLECSPQRVVHGVQCAFLAVEESLRVHLVLVGHPSSVPTVSCPVV